MDKNDCTILICSSDGYTDVWPAFFKLFKTYWTECPFLLLLNTESKSFEYENLNIRCLELYGDNKVSYGERMMAHLNAIETPFTLIMMDDFFLRQKVNEAELEKVIDWLRKDERAVVFSFQAIQDEMNVPSKKYIGYNLRPQYGEYKYNFQAAVWKTDYLRKSWKKHESPWDWETIGNFRSFTSKYDFYSIQIDENTPIDYGFNNSGMGIYRGKWVKESVEQLFKQHDIQVDYSIRGFYTKEYKNIVRMKKKSFINNEIGKIKSIGLVMYCEISIWRLIRQIKKVIGLSVAMDYIDYKRKKIKDKC